MASKSQLTGQHVTSTAVPQYTAKCVDGTYTTKEVRNAAGAITKASETRFGYKVALNEARTDLWVPMQDADADMGPVLNDMLARLNAMTDAVTAEIERNDALDAQIAAASAPRPATRNGNGAVVLSK